jgi:hypothetical protein
MVVGILEWEEFCLISATWSVIQLILGGLDEQRTSRHLCQKEKKDCDPIQRRKQNPRTFRLREVLQKTKYASAPHAVCRLNAGSNCQRLTTRLSTVGTASHSVPSEYQRDE